MKKKLYLIIILSVSVLSCNNIKNVQSNEGVVTIGDNNFIINFPKVDSTYSSKEIAENILLLQKQFREINKEIYENSPIGRNDLLKFEAVDTIVQDQPNEFTPVNYLKETREKMFEAQKAWENLLFGQNRDMQFVDEKSKVISRYKNIADSLTKETFDLRSDIKVALDSLIAENITSSKIDSLLREYLFEEGDKLPLQVEFVRKLDPKSYQRMISLREEDLLILQKGKRPYRINLVNSSSNKIFVAIRYYALDQQWIVSGWYTVSPKDSRTINLYASKDDFYFYASVEGANTYYGDGPSYYVAKGQAFTIVEKYDTDLFEQELKPFFYKSLSLGTDNRIGFSE